MTPIQAKSPTTTGGLSIIRTFLLVLIILTLNGVASGRIVRDTLTTQSNDEIIVTYDISENQSDVILRFDSKPRVIFSRQSTLRSECGGDLEKLKIVFFERIGNFGKVKWKGKNSTAFTVPAGLSLSGSSEGYYIMGECPPLTLTRSQGGKIDFSLPLYLAVYQKKQNYKIIGATSRPLIVKIRGGSAADAQRSATTTTEQIAIKSVEEVEGDNEAVIKALSSLQMIRQLLASETEVPFSQSLQMEIYNLRSLKDRITEPSVVERINELLMECRDKEQELKDADKQQALSAEARQQALLEQQKQEEARLREEAKEEARIQEENAQKRSIWMIVGGTLLAILSFVGNTVFKHFRDIRNQKSIQQMQDSIARQAEYEAARRSREILRNKSGQMANKGRNKMRRAVQSHTATRSAASGENGKGGNESPTSASPGNRNQNNKIKSI